jgi:hypothetical protein
MTEMGLFYHCLLIGICFIGTDKASQGKSLVRVGYNM